MLTEASETNIIIYTAIAQGVFYFITGIWPLVSMRTFEMVTGPKIDNWLVNTVGVLVMVIGAVFILAGIRKNVTLEVLCLASGSAAGLAAIDIVYVIRKRISTVYLLDAFVEIILVAVWIYIYSFLWR